MSRKLARSLLFLLPVMILLPGLGAFPITRGQAYTDYLVSHYPNALYLQNTLNAGQGIPLWSPLILSGYPFAANPLSGIFYPPGWLALALPLPLGLNLLVILHLILAGIGMYLLLREEGLGELPAFFGALAFQALPKLYAHLGAGHLTLIFAVAWTPWLLWCERRFQDAQFAQRLIPGILLGLIALADVRWAAYSGFFWLAYSIRLQWQASRRLGRPDRLAIWIQWLVRVLPTALFAVLIAAALLLPMAEYARLSTRSLLTADDSLYLSLPPGNLLGLVYPAVGASAEWVLYPGAAVFALALFAALRPDARGSSVFWLAAIPLTLLLALGSHLPGMDWIANLPGMSLLRVPPRIVFLTGISFAAAAAWGLNALLSGPPKGAVRARDRSPVVLFAVTAFVALLAVAVVLTMRDPGDLRLRIQFAWGAAFLVIATVLIFAARSAKIKPGLAAALLIGTALVDAVSLNGLSLEFKTWPQVLADSRPVVEYLQNVDDGEPCRVYSPSYSLPQHAGAAYSIEQASGVDPLQLAAYVDFMRKASGVEVEGYSVTLPAYQTGDPTEDNRGAVPDPRLLGLLNIRYIVSAFPITTDGLVLRWNDEDRYIYENTAVFPRAWVQASDAPPGANISPVSQLQIAPNQIVLSAQGPGLLVLSEIAYPGWQVMVDGAPAKIETVGGLLRGVLLPEGAHEVVFAFRPLSVFLGVTVSLITLIGWLVALLIAQRKHV